MKKKIFEIMEEVIIFICIILISIGCVYIYNNIRIDTHTPTVEFDVDTKTSS